MVDVADYLGVTKQAASQLVEQLVQRGYVVREADPGDARSRILKLTERGWACTRAASRPPPTRPTPGDASSAPPLWAPCSPPFRRSYHRQASPGVVTCVGWGAAEVSPERSWTAGSSPGADGPAGGAFALFLTGHRGHVQDRHGACPPAKRKQVHAGRQAQVLETSVITQPPKLSSRARRLVTCRGQSRHARTRVSTASRWPSAVATGRWTRSARTTLSPPREPRWIGRVQDGRVRRAAGAFGQVRHVVAHHQQHAAACEPVTARRSTPSSSASRSCR